MSESPAKEGQSPETPNSEPISIVYSGEQMTKTEVIAYLYELTRFKKEFTLYDERRAARQRKMRTLETESQCRRTFPLPHRDPPRGLELLSSRKKQEYQRWLDDAPKREQEKRRKEEEENRRIADLREQNRKLSEEGLEDSAKMSAMAKQFEKLIQRQVIAPDYREGDIPQLLMMYLFNGRANTLPEAINLYHEEKYRMEMMAIAKQQQQEAHADRKRQLELAWQQLDAQREQAENLAAIAKSAEETKNSAKNAEFLLWLDYFSN